MNYPIDEFLSDYRAVLASARTADRADVESGKALRQPFQMQYQGEILQERMLAHQRVMMTIDRHRKRLAEFGYVRLGSDSHASWIHDNVVRALHRLIIEQGNADPPIDEIKRITEFFISRN
jgi:hypothetical protein